MRKIYMIAALAFMASSCSQSDGPAVPGSSDEVNFKVEYASQSRATASGFENGDVMGVFMTQYDGESAVPLQVSGNYANNVKSTLTAGKWINTPAIYWDEGKFNVYAYYPYGSVTSVDNMLFDISLDQSAAESGTKLSGYEASDFLWARREGISRSESVELSFRHILSSLVINLVKGEDYSGDLPDDAEVFIHNTVASALIDLSTGSVEKNGRDTERTIKACKTGNQTYKAIIVPQRIENSRPLVEVVTEGVSFLVERKFVFRSGTQHTINVILSDNPGKVKIEIGGEVGDWN